jgi:hypothetical protein
VRPRVATSNGSSPPTTSQTSWNDSTDTKKPRPLAAPNRQQPDPRRTYKPDHLGEAVWLAWCGRRPVHRGWGVTVSPPAGPRSSHSPQGQGSTVRSGSRLGRQDAARTGTVAVHRENRRLTPAAKAYPLQAASAPACRNRSTDEGNRPQLKSGGADPLRDHFERKTH